MLRNDLYNILTLDTSEHTLRAEIGITKSHPIFEGHFPGQPVLPGVCMIQIVRELMEVQCQKSFRLISADNIKFLSVLDPEKTESVTAVLNFSIEGNLYNVQATLARDQVFYFKFKGVLQAS